MIILKTKGGQVVDMLPNQDVSLNIENPLLTSDRIPIAWSSDFELAPTTKNFEIFDFAPGIYAPPKCRQVDADIYSNGISIASGKLEFTEVTAESFCISFSGASIEHSLSGMLHEAPLGRWNFGRFDTPKDHQLYNEVVNRAMDNQRSDFTLPMLIRSDKVDTPDLFTNKFHPDTYYYWAAKYANCPNAPYIIPVIKLGHLLSCLMGEYIINDDYISIISKIGIVAPYRKNGDPQDYEHGCLDKNMNGIYELDLASGLAAVEVIDFVKSALSSLCATIFFCRQDKYIVSNKSIVESLEFVDWTQKVSDQYDIAWEDGILYEYGYNGVAEPKKIEGVVVEYDTMMACFGAGDNKTVRHLPTGDIYTTSQKQVSVQLGSGMVISKTATHLNIVEQGGMYIRAAEVAADQESYSALSDLTPVRSRPQNYYLQMGKEIISRSYIVPEIDFPELGLERGTDIYFGIIHQSQVPETVWISETQLSSNGVYGSGFDVWNETADDVQMGDLYRDFHSEFANWLAKDKTVYRFEMNLTAVDIYNLQLWRKVMLRNQLFFIKNMSFTFNTSTSNIKTEAEFIKA